MKNLVLPSLETLQGSTAGDIFSNNSEGKFELYSFIDLDTLEVNSSNNPVFNIGTDNITFANGDIYLNGIDFQGHSNVVIGGSSKFKKIVSNQITASFDVNSSNNDMIDAGSGIEKLKQSGQFLLSSKLDTSISSVGYKNISSWNSNTTKEFDLLNNQNSIFFDLNSDSLNTGTINKPSKITIRLPELFPVGNILDIAFWLDSVGSNKPNPFDIVFEKQGSTDIQIFTQFFGYEVNTKRISSNNIDVTRLTSNFSFNMLYLGNNFLNINMGDGLFPGTNSYEEKSIVANNPYNQWMIIEF